MKTIPRQPPTQIGDRVKIDFGRRQLTGAVVEDRGAIGVQGRRIFVVSVPMDPMDPMLVELPEDEFEPLSPELMNRPILDKQMIISYLSNGGLIAILQSNTSGGRNHPGAWLCLDTLGSVTHTFVPERGVIGGQAIPFSASHNGKIFKPRREDVEKFVQSFGLNHQEAQQVVSNLGTAS